MSLPSYVYVASSWRNNMQDAVVCTLNAAGIGCYDFKHPEGGKGFSWAEVEPEQAQAEYDADPALQDLMVRAAQSETVRRVQLAQESRLKTVRRPECRYCGKPIAYSSFTGLGGYEPGVDPGNDPVIWRHIGTGYAACPFSSAKAWRGEAIPTEDPRAVAAKGSDWVPKEKYLAMIAHPRSIEGFKADFDAMQRADTFVMVLPCGKSAHLELGWAIGAGKRTCILLEDPVEPELMYLMADHLATSVMDLLEWMGVKN